MSLLLLVQSAPYVTSDAWHPITPCAKISLFASRCLYHFFFAKCALLCTILKNILRITATQAIGRTLNRYRWRTCTSCSLIFTQPRLPVPRPFIGTKRSRPPKRSAREFWRQNPCARNRHFTYCFSLWSHWADGRDMHSIRFRWVQRAVTGSSLNPILRLEGPDESAMFRHLSLE